MQAKLQLKSKAAYKKKTFFLREVQQELKKVTWTTKQELISCTKIVIGSTFLLGIGIYAMDLVIQGSLQLISSVAKWIGG